MGNLVIQLKTAQAIGPVQTRTSVAITLAALQNGLEDKYHPINMTQDKPKSVMVNANAEVMYLVIMLRPFN